MSGQNAINLERVTINMRRVVLSIGGNLGDRLATLQSAVDAIRALPTVEVEAISSVYETEPWGPVPQGDFLNAIVILGISEDVKPLSFLAQLHKIENDHGRLREVQYGPRTLDLDIVVFGDYRSDLPELTLPHPFAHQRAFVLVAWADVEPDACIQPYGAISNLLKLVDVDSVMLRGDLTLT